MSANKQRDSDGVSRYRCISADRIGAVTKIIMKQAGFDTSKFAPHTMRALAARRLINLQGERVARTLGGWSEGSRVLRHHYVPRTVAVVPPNFREQQLEEVSADRSAD